MPWVRFMIPSPLFDTLIEFEMHVIHSIHRSRFSIALYLEGNHVPSPRFRVRHKITYRLKLLEILYAWERASN